MLGSIVKQFPRLEGLTLLPSQGADSFYLLNSGQLMLADNIASKAGTNTKQINVEQWGLKMDLIPSQI